MFTILQWWEERRRERELEAARLDAAINEERARVEREAWPADEVRRRAEFAQPEQRPGQVNYLHAERDKFIEANNDGGGFGKLSNPKDEIGSDKVPLHLIPTTALAEVALAFLEGALKYGTANWRKAGVRASIYQSARARHGDKWWEGQDRDPHTKVHHLASEIACKMILLDAILAGKMTDDRPVACGAEDRAPERLDALAENVKHLKVIFAKHNPHHWTRNNEVNHDEQE